MGALALVLCAARRMRCPRAALKYAELFSPVYFRHAVRQWNVNGARLRAGCGDASLAAAPDGVIAVRPDGSVRMPTVAPILGYDAVRREAFRVVREGFPGVATSSPRIAADVQAEFEAFVG